MSEDIRDTLFAGSCSLCAATGCAFLGLKTGAEEGIVRIYAVSGVVKDLRVFRYVKRRAQRRSYFFGDTRSID
jgi:hypothetical protein